jgi:hypothetical protein
MGAEVICSWPTFIFLGAIANITHESASRNCAIAMHSSLMSVKVVLRRKAFIAYTARDITVPGKRMLQFVFSDIGKRVFFIHKLKTQVLTLALIVYGMSYGSHYKPTDAPDQLELWQRLQEEEVGSIRLDIAEGHQRVVDNVVGGFPGLC